MTNPMFERRYKVEEKRIREIRANAVRNGDRVLYAVCNTALGGYGWVGVNNWSPENMSMAEAALDVYEEVGYLPGHALPEIDLDSVPGSDELKKLFT